MPDQDDGDCVIPAEPAGAEARRLAVLDSYRILDTPAEPAFDDIVLLASRLCRTPIALVSLIAADRQWFKARRGLEASQTPLAQSVCRQVLAAPGVLVIPDLRDDPRTRANMLVTATPGLRFYAGTRLESPDGVPIGALCVIDHAARPEGLTPEQAESLAALGRQVITALELRRALHVAQTRVAALFDRQSRRWRHSNDLLGVADAAGAFESVNPAWQRVLGWNEAEIMGRAFLDFVHPDDMAGTQKAWADLLGGVPVFNFENRYRHRDGSYRWLSWISVPEAGKVHCTARDITATKNQEAALRETASALLTERDTAELREQFIAVLGHDLRNPLASVDAGIRLLAPDQASARSAFVLRTMQQSVVRMSRLIDNLMDFARGRLGGGLSLSLRPEPALAASLTHVIAELQAAWPDRVIEAELRIGGPVRCDAARLGQMLSNLIANAIVHGSPDAPILVRAAADAAGLELSVRNAGPTLPPESRERLFQPFFRGAVRASQQGLGLGLYIVSEIARAHGGTIEVASLAEETVFTFRMAALAEDAPGEEKPGEEKPGEEKLGEEKLGEENEGGPA